MNRPFRNKLSFSITLAILLSLLLASWALASDVDVAVVDVTVPTNSVTLAPGKSGSININISVTGQQEGTATFKVYSDWTLSGGTFTGSNPQEFTVGPREGGAPATTFSTTGSVSVAAGQSTGTFTLAVGAFDITNSNKTGAKLAAGNSSNYEVTVTLPSNTAPTVIVTKVTDGEDYEFGSVPTAICEVSDSEDGDSFFDATLSDIMGHLSAYGLGSQTASCSYTDKGGLTAYASATYSIVDTTDPVITFQSRTPANENGWNNTDVEVIWSCTDSGSGVVATEVSQTVSDEGEDLSATGTCTDRAGNTASNEVSDINIDKTAPALAPTVSPNPAIVNQDVEADPGATDERSGIASASCHDVNTSQAGTFSVSCTATDYAGNTARAETTYTVSYKVCVLYDQSKSHKKGSTVPIKLQLCDINGANLSGPSIILNAANLVKVDSTASANVEDSGNANPDFNFRYSEDLSGYIYNLSTKSLTSSGTWKLNFMVAGLQSTYSVQFDVK